MSPLARVTMPKASVDEYHGPILRQNYIGATRKILPMQAETVP